MSLTAVIYLIHFDQPFKHAKHYLGSAADLDARIAQHRTAGGANLMRVVNAAGIPWRVARLWRGGRTEERRLKKNGGMVRLCPICTPGTTRGRFIPSLTTGHEVRP